MRINLTRGYAEGYICARLKSMGEGNLLFTENGF